jgi:hypothetical protein
LVTFDPPETTFVKGIGFDCAMRFAERELGSEPVARALDALKEHHGDYAAYRRPDASVPLKAAAAAWSAVDDLHPGDREVRRQFFRDMGVFIADTNLHGAYRTILSLLVNPVRLAKRLPTFWTTYFRGVEATVDLAGLRSGGVTTEVVGFGGAPHVGEMAEGWIRFSFELVGGTGVEVHEEALHAGADAPGPTMRFAVRWAR